MDEISLLSSLLSIYSPTHHEAEAVNFLVSQMQATGYDQAFVDAAGNAVGVKGAGPATIVLLGHIDTVPGFIPVTQDGDRLNGRGAVDAKGPLAAFTAAVARATPPAGKRFVVIGAVGEEGDSRGAHHVKDQYRPAFTIIGEPSHWEKITLGYKGSAWFDYTVQRTLAHTSAQNESACEAAVSFWNRVTAWAAARNGDSAKMFEQVNPTLRGMNSESDGFVETARLKFGVRLPPGLIVEDLDVALRELTLNAELICHEGVAAYRGEKNTPLVRAFLAAIRQAGGNPTFTLKSGTADMNIVAPVWGTPIVAYGPGDSALDHTPDEHIMLNEYQQAIAVLVRVLEAL